MNYINIHILRTHMCVYIYIHTCVCVYTHIHIYTYTHMGFPGGTSSKEPTYQCRKPKRQVWSLGQEDPLEEGMATHSNILAWRIPWIKEPGGLQSIRSHRILHDWRDLAHMHAHTHTHTHSCIHMLFQNLFHCRLLQGIEYSPVLYSKSMLLHNSWGWVPEAQKLHCPSVWLDVSIRLHDLFHSQGVKTLPYSVQNKGLICKYVSEEVQEEMNSQRLRGCMPGVGLDGLRSVI